MQLSDGHEVLPEGGGEKAVQTLPVHHPRQENLQRAAAAQTHEARERKLPQGAETVWDCLFFFSPVKLLSKLCIYVAEVQIRVQKTDLELVETGSVVTSLLGSLLQLSRRENHVTYFADWKQTLETETFQRLYSVTVRRRANSNRQSDNFTECQAHSARVLPHHADLPPESFV